MTYKTQFNMTQDSMLLNRITACAAMEKVADPPT